MDKELVKSVVDDLEYYVGDRDFEGYIKQEASQIAYKMDCNYNLKDWAATEEGFEWAEKALERYGWEGCGKSLLGVYKCAASLMYEQAIRKELRKRNLKEDKS